MHHRFFGILQILFLLQLQLQLPLEILPPIVADAVIATHTPLQNRSAGTRPKEASFFFNGRLEAWPIPHPRYCACITPTRSISIKATRLSICLVNMHALHRRSRCTSLSDPVISRIRPHMHPLPRHIFLDLAAIHRMKAQAEQAAQAVHAVHPVQRHHRENK